MLDWIKQGNLWYHDNEDVPDHTNLTAIEGRGWCFTQFPMGVLFLSDRYPSEVYIEGRSSRIVSGISVGEERGQLLPGLYEYRIEGDNRVPSIRCRLYVNRDETNESYVDLPIGEPFTFRFFGYHNLVLFRNWGSRFETCYGALYRIGD